ncbi:MAG: hypothetical protein JSS32_05645 [Verrucomicrobia bacterium]|nr:hypothetical protein [Verrucomicrobiota bacterium]
MKKLIFWTMMLFSIVHADPTKAFSALPQLLLPGEAILLENVFDPSCEIDLSLAPASGLIIFKKSGTYKIVWSGQTHRSIPWTLGFSLDNTILFGNIYQNSNSTKFEGSVVLSINAGQTLQFVNASQHPVDLVLASQPFTVILTLFEPPDQFLKTYGWESFMK